MRAELRTYLKEHRTDFISFKTQIFQKEAEQDPIRRAELIREVVNSIAKVPDPIQRQVYIKATSTQLEMDEAMLIAEMNKIHIQQQRSEARRASQNSPSELFPGIKSASSQQWRPHRPARTRRRGGVMPLPLPRTGRHSPIEVLYGDYTVDDETKVCRSHLPEDWRYLPCKRSVRDNFCPLPRPGRAGMSVTKEQLIGKGDSEMIAKEVIDMVVDHYVLSENWEVRHNIHAAPEGRTCCTR